MPTLALGFSTRDDEGAWWTLNDAMLHYGDLIDEVIIVDNSKSGSSDAAYVEEMCKGLGSTVKYVRASGPASSCVYKHRVFSEATSDYVLQCDSHVLFVPGAIAALRAYLESSSHRDDDLVVAGCMKSYAREMGTNQMLYASESYARPKDAEVSHGFVARGGVLGVWVFDERARNYNGPAFEVQQQGTFAFCMRRERWPGFPREFLGHGGNETYLMESVRAAGGRVMYLPAFRGVHRFMRAATPYAVRWQDRARNYLLGAARLEREDMYDAAHDHLIARCPSAVREAAKAARRPTTMYETELLRLARGDRAIAARLAGGAIPRRMFEQLRRELKQARGAVTIEFGSGISTALFESAGCQHTALEQSDDWVSRVARPSVQRVELRGGWYDWKTPDDVTYDLILVDGPSGVGPDKHDRRSCLQHFPWERAVKPSTVVYVDDTHRENERDLAAQLSARLGRVCVTYEHGQRRYARLCRA